MEQVMMPLPNEPVGVGAVWRSSREVETNGMKMTSVNTFSLTKIDGDKLTFTIDTDVHGANQTVKLGSDSLDVSDITGQGGGDGTTTLTSLEMTAVLTAEFRNAMKAPGETTATPMKIVTQTKIAPTGAALPSGPPIAPPPAATGSDMGSAAAPAMGSGSNAPAMGSNGSSAPAMGSAATPAMGSAATPAMGSAATPAMGSAARPAMGTAAAPAMGSAH